MDIHQPLDTPEAGAARDGFATACADARRALARVRALTAGSPPVGGTDLLERLDAAAAMARETDLVIARLGREIEARSDASPGGGIVRRCGHRNAAELLAARRGSSRTEAMRLLSVGRVLEESERVDGTPAPPPGSVDPTTPGAPAADSTVPTPGEERAVASATPGLPGMAGMVGDNAPQASSAHAGTVPGGAAAAPAPQPKHPHVSAALARGELSVECASQIMAMLDGLEDRVGAPSLEEAERALVVKARGLAADRFARVVRQLRARLDPEGHERDLVRMRQARAVRLFENREGMTVISGILDPETVAPLRTALDALVGDAMRRSRDAVGEDTRTVDQMRADSLAALARHALGCEATDLPLSTVTMIVRIDEASLRDRVGQAELEGSPVPLDASTLRRIAADAEVIPAVLGGQGEVLDLGRRRRLFTRAQRRALGERDGGCAFCGAPPAWTEVHHIRWWGRDRGRTDLSNGVLLCSHCHTTVHQQEWEIRATATEVWFIPPATVDPARAPRRGGRARFHAPVLDRGPGPGRGPDREPTGAVA